MKNRSYLLESWNQSDSFKPKVQVYGLNHYNDLPHDNDPIMWLIVPCKYNLPVRSIHPQLEGEWVPNKRIKAPISYAGWQVFVSTLHPGLSKYGNLQTNN